MSRIIVLACLVIVMVVALDVPRVWSQPPRERSYGGERRGMPDSKTILQGLDTNHNGIIEPSEVTGRSKYFVDRAAQRAGLDTSKPIPLDKLVDAMQAGRESSGESREKAGKPEDKPADVPAATPSGKSPAVPGFGADSKIPKVSGFGGPSTGGAAGSLEQRFDRRVMDEVDRMMRDYDKNKDGVLDADEMKAVPWTSDPKQSDLNKDGKIDKSELAERTAKRFGTDSSKSGDRRGGPSSSGGAPAGNSNADEMNKIKEYAKQYIKPKDIDGNGMLEKNKGEWSDVNSENQKADVNNDGVITLDELTAKFAAYGKGDASTVKAGGSSSGSPSGHDSSRSASSSSKPSTGIQKSYRPLSPADRLAKIKDLPDWFLRSDADEDGQVSMSEYTAAWSDSKATEFASFDLDGDGFVTAKECQKKAERKAEKIR